MHKTSLNISGRISNELGQASLRFGISRRKLIISIFMYCHRYFDFEKFQYGLTKYQKKVPEDVWKCFRIDLDDTCCDVYFFYRNRFRISLSRLLAVGFTLFFDQIIRDLKERCENTGDLKNVINSYTELKLILMNFLKDSFKYFQAPYNSA
ncbi:MAG: hypothetical protein JW982_07215 [Spirochaetes bacterium]|nr:hypothetical protein [Spirochaetota bacterium]